MTWLGGRENDAIYSMYTEKKFLPSSFSTAVPNGETFLPRPKKFWKDAKNTQKYRTNTTKYIYFNLHTFCMNQGQGLFVSIVHISTQKDWWIPRNSALVQSSTRSSLSDNGKGNRLFMRLLSYRREWHRPHWRFEAFAVNDVGPKKVWTP